MPAQIILASTSRYRAHALEQLKLSFSVKDPGIDERLLDDERPAQRAIRLAREKAKAVADEFNHAVVIGADQVGYCNGQTLHKPGAAAKAVEQLRSVSGKRAQFYSGLAVYNPRQKEIYDAVVVTKLTFRNISKSQAERYVQLDQPLDCAGAFKVESLGIALFSEVQSEDPSALIGLPLIALVTLLAKCEVHPF